MTRYEELEAKQRAFDRQRQLDAAAIGMGGAPAMRFLAQNPGAAGDIAQGYAQLGRSTTEAHTAFQDRLQRQREFDATMRLRERQEQQGAYEFERGLGERQYQFDQGQQADARERDLQRQFAAERDVYDTEQRFALSGQQHTQALDLNRQRVEAQAWLNEQELSQKERMQLQRMQAAVGDVMANPDLTAEEKNDLVLQLKTGIDPLARRLKMTQDRALQERMNQEAQTHAQQAAAADQALQFSAKSMQQRVAVLPNPETGEKEYWLEMGPGKAPQRLFENATKNKLAEEQARHKQQLDEMGFMLKEEQQHWASKEREQKAEAAKQEKEQKALAEFKKDYDTTYKRMTTKDALGRTVLPKEEDVVAAMLARDKVRQKAGGAEPAAAPSPERAELDELKRKYGKASNVPPELQGRLFELRKLLGE